ncbi:MAG TPA: carboxypeptidase-like regulatory domain-containing protein, partial [Candidatus Ozemobacteraceae bacterium]|nr:carboxypeptidase-like regulatory domain-containing protein [Candidatus Ozemobacteraceae bacterium]
MLSAIVKLMRSLALFCVVTGLLIFLGCLGAGGGGSLGRSPIDPADTNLVSGIAYFADRQLFGGIPILARDANTGAVGGLVRTDSRGAFAFTSLPPAIYNLTATTGNGETTFYSGLQVTGQQAQAIPEASLLGLKDLIIDRVSTASVRITFHSNLEAISQI